MLQGVMTCCKGCRGVWHVVCVLGMLQRFVACYKGYIACGMDVGICGMLYGYVPCMGCGHVTGSWCANSML